MPHDEIGIAPNAEYFRVRTRGNRIAASSPAIRRMREDLKLQILRYLTLHPGARDSAEGIRIWWLDRGSIATPAEVEDVLDELVALGWVEHRGEGTMHLYGLLPSAAGAIRDYVSQDPSRG